MLPVSKLVGAFTHGLTLSRAKSDATSVNIAQKYLKNEFLRGFPVPRMSLKNVDLELNFAVGPSSRIASLLQEPEICKNITYQFHDVVNTLSKSTDFQKVFGQPPPPSLCRRAISSLESNVTRILSKKSIDIDLLQHTLVLALENFLRELHRHKPESNALSGFRRLFSKEEPTQVKSPDADSIRNWATKKVNDVLNSALPGGLANLEEGDELNIMLGGPELEGLNTEHLHKAKLSFNADDRKWVATETNGKKSYILDR